MPVGKPKTLRHYANDRGRLAVEAHSTAQHTLRSAERLLPEVITDDHHERRSRSILVFREHATEYRLNAQHLEHRRAHARCGQTHGRGSVQAEIARLSAVAAQVCEGALTRTPFSEVLDGGRHAVVAAALRVGRVD